MLKWLAITLLILLALIGAAAWFLTPEPLIRSGMVASETEHFVFHALPQTAAAVDEVAPIMEKYYKRVTDVLQYQPHTKISVVIYASQRDFHRSARGRILDFIDAAWFVGDNRNDSVLMVSPQVVNPVHKAEAIVQVSVHEFVHVIEDRINPNLPLYLHEGIALYLADQPMRFPITQPLSDLPDADTLFQRRKNAITSLTFGNNGGYHLAYLLVEYWVGEYGEESLPALLRNPTHLEDVAGKDYKAVYADRVDYIQHNYSAEVFMR